MYKEAHTSHWVMCQSCAKAGDEKNGRKERRDGGRKEERERGRMEGWGEREGERKGKRKRKRKKRKVSLVKRR